MKIDTAIIHMSVHVYVIFSPTFSPTQEMKNGVDPGKLCYYDLMVRFSPLLSL